LQPAAAGLLAAIVEPGQGVQINTLGSFRVVRDGRTVALAEWPSREALTLLKLLAARQGRPVSNTTIAEVLWPEEDERHIAARIPDLVNSARSVLDPTRRYTTNHYVTSDANALALAIDHVDLDIARLLKTAREGLRYIDEQDWERALPLLQSVEDLYAGDFLDEDAYEPWSADCRDQARIAACDASRTLARLAARQADDEGACRHLRRVLERDPHDEEAWLSLMATLVRIRRHGEARRAYAAYTRRMNEVGVVPAPFDRSGAAATPKTATERLLATVLFTDIVDSTAHVLSIGDRSWRDTLDLHDAMVRHELARHHGREIKTMGDGVLATFDSPARAIACATAIRDAVGTLGLDIRCGLHTGEVELRGEDIGGLAVHIAARISRIASPGEVLISRTVRDLLGGSGVRTTDRGLHALAGLHDQWQLYAVESHALPQPPLVGTR
jgi:class 3 adenylate cyclase